MKYIITESHERSTLYNHSFLHLFMVGHMTSYMAIKIFAPCV